MDTMKTKTEAAPGNGGFRHVLAVIDESGDGRHAAAFAAVVADQFGAAVTTVEVRETKARHRSGVVHGLVGSGQTPGRCDVTGPTVGARNHELSGQIAAAAGAVGADVIVLGMDRHRLARHRLAPSLRALVAEASDVAALQAPPVPVHEEPGTLAHDRPGIDPLGVEVTGTLHKGRYAGV
jgi:nucleotide-binding universal stress UspA family protein